MNEQVVSNMQSIKYGRYIVVTLKSGKVLNGEFRGLTQMLDKDGNHQLTADVLNIAAFVTNPDLPAAKAESMFGIRVTHIKQIKTYLTVDEQQKEVQLERAMRKTMQAISNIDWDAVNASAEIK